MDLAVNKIFLKFFYMRCNTILLTKGTLCEIKSGTLTTTTTTTTTTPSISICPAGLNYCLNNGLCYVVNGNLQCSCVNGFSGI